MEKLNRTVAEGYPSRNTETAGLLRDQFVKPPRSARWYDMHVDKKDSSRSTVCSWSPEPAKLNSAFSNVSRRNLPTAPPSQALSHDVLRRWKRAAREQSVMCNQAAGLSRCLTRMQDAMSTQLKNLHSDRGKSSERMQQAVDELEYLHMGVKQDTLTALRTAPVHLQSLFPDQLLNKAEEEVARSEERCFSSQPHIKPSHFHPYASNDKPSPQQDRKLSIPAWKQIRECQQGKKGRGKPTSFSQKTAKGSKQRK